jgi:hypothetical protein
VSFSVPRGGESKTASPAVPVKVNCPLPFPCELLATQLQSDGKIPLINKDVLMKNLIILVWQARKQSFNFWPLFASAQSDNSGSIFNFFELGDEERDEVKSKNSDKNRIILGSSR